MEKEISTQQLAELIANPERITEDHAPLLSGFARLYPYFQPVHLLLAKATANGDEGNTNLATAALYTNGQLLHNILHEPEQLLDTSFNIVPAASFGTLGNEPEALDETAIDEVPSEPEESIITDEQETFDEIGEVNINEYYPAKDLNADIPVEEDAFEKETLEDNLVLENIVSTDFFAFQDNFKVEPVMPGTETDALQAEEHTGTENREQEETTVSKYDDDRLPYTFLWWLAKTRKEHQQIFQPYASPKKGGQEQEDKSLKQNRPNELQQQYVEHIFHMQSPFNEEETDYSTANFKRHTKGDEIIESFIKNEPQISPPKPEQINNENKARKSAEDHNDIVSETLANIYIEQTLYDKAIETYEKLSLKFPEKSRYFADLIQSIEKKI